MMTNQFDTISMINNISQLEHTASFSSKPKRMEKSKPKLEKKNSKVNFQPHQSGHQWTLWASYYCLVENYTPYIHVYFKNINCGARFKILRIIKHHTLFERP